MTNQEIEQLKQQLKEKNKEIRAIYDKLVEAGAWPLDDDALDGVAGGRVGNNYGDPTSTTDHPFL